MARRNGIDVWVVELLTGTWTQVGRNGYGALRSIPALRRAENWTEGSVIGEVEVGCIHKIVGNVEMTYAAILRR